jgi:ATP-dependent RNA helicase SUPV3L1/SUV3
LRLLARENYDRMVAAKGVRNVALITGEEKIVPQGARWFSCTVEAMPIDRACEFLAVDEIQLCADADRGHVFTDRLLHARGTVETMFLGAETIRPLLAHLVPEADIEIRPRLSQLTFAGSAKLTRLPPRSAIVAFSAGEVYAIAEMIRRRRGGCAVVMGRLSPRTRNAQVALYQDGEVDFLVATDAIGMGLNMDVNHVAFAGLQKFDGHRPRRRRARAWCAATMRPIWRRWTHYRAIRKFAAWRKAASVCGCCGKRARCRISAKSPMTATRASAPASSPIARAAKRCRRIGWRRNSPRWAAPKATSTP